MWKRLFAGQRQPVQAAPAWAGFFTDQQYHDFLRLVERHFRKRRMRYRLGDGVVFLGNSKLGSQHQLGLFNLAQLCGQHPQGEWASIITDHFQTMEKSQREQVVLEERVRDYSRVEELLAIRLWPGDFLNQIDRNKVIHRVDLPGTISALVFDLPSSVRNVTPDEAEVWGKGEDELFEIALAQVRENCIPDKSEQELSPGIALHVLQDESFFVASHALLIEDHPECIGSFGSLIGIPRRRELLAYPIENLKVIPAINMLIPIIMGMERDGPGSISSRLYWYRDGEYTDLPYRVEDQSLVFGPPREFIDMLQLLSDGDDFSSFDGVE